MIALAIEARQRSDRHKYNLAAKSSGPPWVYASPIYRQFRVIVTRYSRLHDDDSEYIYKAMNGKA